MPAEDVVCGRYLTYVSDGMQLVGGLENNRARPHALHLAVDQHLHDTLFNDQDLLFGVLVGWVRRFAGVKGSNMAF